MVQGYLDYIDKQECIRRGFTPRANGGFYKLNVLEKLEKDGYLDFGNPKYTSGQRVSAGNLLRLYYDLSGVGKVHTVDPSRIRVDGSGNKVTPEAVAAAEQAYRRSIRCLPDEFKSIVTDVCCRDKELVLVENSERKRTHEKHRQAMILCLGLDRLVEHYRR